MRQTNTLLRNLIAATTFSCAVASAACATPGAPMAPEAVVTNGGTLADSTAFCIAEINRLRATVGQPALARSSRIDSFSADAAHVDGEAHQAHTYFLQTNGGNGTAKAENVIPWWKASQYGSVHAIIQNGLATMWAEGPGGAHYENIKGAFTEMGCGVFVSNDEVTVSQDFR